MLTAADIPLVPALESLAATLLPRVLAAPAPAWVPMPAATMYRGEWRALLFSAGPWAAEFPAADLTANLRTFPDAAALLAGHPELGVFGVLSLAAGAELLPHRDRRDDSEIRVHIPFQLGGETDPPWVLHRARLLDIRSLHRGHNPGVLPRLTLVADVRLERTVALGEVAEWDAAVAEPGGTVHQDRASGSEP